MVALSGFFRIFIISFNFLFLVPQIFIPAGTLFSVLDPLKESASHHFYEFQNFEVFPNFAGDFAPFAGPGSATLCT